LSFRRLERQARRNALGSCAAPFLRKDKQANTTGVRNTAMGPEDGSSLRKDKQASSPGTGALKTGRLSEKTSKH